VVGVPHHAREEVPPSWCCGLAIIEAEEISRTSRSLAKFEVPTKDLLPLRRPAPQSSRQGAETRTARLSRLKKKSRPPKADGILSINRLFVGLRGEAQVVLHLGEALGKLLLRVVVADGGAMMTSSPSFQSTGVETGYAAESCSESRTRTISSTFRPPRRVGQGQLHLLVRRHDETLRT